MRRASRPTLPDSENPGRHDASGGRVNELDLLRFLAALAVVLFHYAFRGYAADGLSPMPYPALAPFARYGFLGVELFFLISGFVILMTAAGSNLRSFVVSRAVRLYPAFWICCSVSFIALLLFGAARGAPSFGQYLVNMTLLNYAFGVASIDGVYWSLFIELKFYAFIALLLLCGWLRHAQGLLLIWLAAAVGLALAPVGILRSLLIADYAPYFIGGALCFLIWSRGTSPLRLAALAIAWLLALYQSGAEMAEFESHYRERLAPHIVAIVITASYAIMLLVALRKTGAIARRRWLTLGALTYPLYLLHQNVGYLIFTAAYPAVDPHVLLWGTLALMLLAAHGIHVLLERPLAARLKGWLTNTGQAPVPRRIPPSPAPPPALAPSPPQTDSYRR